MISIWNMQRKIQFENKIVVRKKGLQGQIQFCDPLFFKNIWRKVYKYENLLALLFPDFLGDAMYLLKNWCINSKLNLTIKLPYSKALDSIGNYSKQFLA